MIERLYPLRLVERNLFLAFIVGLFFSFIGIGLSAWLFRGDPALVTVAFISLLTYPLIKRLINDEIAFMCKKKDIKKKHISRHGKLMMIYLMLFLGIMIGYSIYSMILPYGAAHQIFENQIGIYTGVRGNATLFKAGLFTKLFDNNFKVLILIFITSLLIGDGGIFLLTWNASVWGAIFGILAKTAATSTSLNPLFLFTIILSIILPHTLLEALSYIIAAVAGGVTSRAVLLRKSESKSIRSLLLGILFLSVLALVTLFIAVGLEQFVLLNSDLYARIIVLSGLR